MSFKATCGLSNLPIHKDDEVVAFLIKEKSLGELRGGQFSNVDDLFIPISAPIFARYDGYGAIKDINPKYKDLILEQVRSLFNTYPVGERLLIKEDTSSIDMSKASLEDIVYEFERGNVIKKVSEETMTLYKESGEFHRGYYFTGIVLFHKDIFEKLIALKINSELHKESYNLAKKFELIDFKKELGEQKFDVLMNQVIHESRLPHSECKNFDVYMYWYKNTQNRTINTELLDYLRQGALICDVMSSLAKPWMPQVIFKDSDESIVKELNSVINVKINTPKQDTSSIKKDSIPNIDLEVMESIARRFNVDLTEELKLGNMK